MIYRIISVFAFVLIISCNGTDKRSKANDGMVRLITLDPGHFHAALVQKIMYPGVDSTVYVYAPEGNDLKLHMDRIDAYHARKDDPTHWKENVYTGEDYFETMLKEKAGNVVVLAGNNRKKTEYILRSLENGFNVLADKPMAIDSHGFDLLKQAFNTAKANNLLLYDIMTERFEITSVLQRELTMLPEVFGTLDTGSVDKPAVIMVSEHNFYKNVSGNVVVRPGWFMDASQQGEGIVDVTTHLVDLVQWECFPDQSLEYTKDIIIDSAKRWPTNMSVSQFKTITKMDYVPSFLDDNKLNDSTIKVWSNGEINYAIKGVHAKVSVIWEYQTASGNDTHYSFMRGTKASLLIKQGPEQHYQPTLYILPAKNDDAFEKALLEQFKKIQDKYPGVELKKSLYPPPPEINGHISFTLPKENCWEVVIPDKYKEGHESHFARVMQNYLEYLKNKNMPAWEVPNMLAKYYTTTRALEVALQNK